MSLGEQAGTTVSLSYRKEAFSRIKEGNRERLDRAAFFAQHRVGVEDEIGRAHV